MITLTWRTKLLLLLIILALGSFLFQILYLIPCIKENNIEIRTEQQEQNAFFIAMQIESTVQRFESRINVSLR